MNHIIISTGIDNSNAKIR